MSAGNSLAGMNSPARFGPDGFPSWGLFADVCRHGLSVVRPVLSANGSDQEGWNFGSARPPSYFAYGRLRALLALSESLALRPRRVLEVAAGDGSLCASLQMAGCEVTANDLRKENLEQAVAHFSNGSNIRLLSGNLFDLDPSQTGQFDLLIACEILEHVAHTVDFLRQLKRFLTPDGLLLLTTPNGANFRNRLPTYSQIGDFTALERNQFKPDADGHLFLITPAELRQIASQAGLEVRRLLLWGTPFISGESGMRLLGGILPPRVCYALERLSQNLGPSLLSKLANSLSAVLSLPREVH